MSELSQFLLESDIHFYKDYAIPIIKSNSKLFDLDEFDSILRENKSIPIDRTIKEAYKDFELDKKSQYEMHPKFGRYVWDIADQWYQKWNVVFSVEHMWNWIKHGVTRSSAQLSTTKDHIFDATYIQPWLNRIIVRYNVHPDHQNLLQDICKYIGDWHQSNRSLTLRGSFKLNTIPLFPPTWFTNKSKQNCNRSEGLAPSYLATFVPPYRLEQQQIPERWDQVFLKGLTVDPNHKFNLDPILIASAIPILGLTVNMDEESGYSKLFLVMIKAKYGNLEDKIENDVPVDYYKPCQMAISITKDIKDLHWNYIHGNIHPRNILLNNADYLGELVDITFMRRNDDTLKNNWSGRWPYVAPEVVSTGLSTSADIYALGIILWQLISRVTFPGDVLIDPHVYRIEPIPNVLREWEDIYSDCLHIDPKKRPNAYTIHRRLTHLCNKLRNNKIPLSKETLHYIKVRRQEIHQFLDDLKTSPSPLIPSSLLDGTTITTTTSTSTSTTTITPTSSSHTLCEVGNHVLTASVTRPSHQRLNSYPNLIQKFPGYS
ncbi:kinase-like domain-containing protein [Cokeromyces recurvatus]|uniref:kinase-like domain-containing protein n=1 Tax=Cokeromyces recurvatus TaxID=90255 RepID=UPI00221E49C7|nr:kinase-like domain-containing protein [Cokeromyces recurvatus]KAI7903092.1 kinase-like domain-containing protein [Cokeromyces recurvatus]